MNKIVSQEEIEKLSTEELLSLLEDYENKVTIYDGKQNAIKINLNSCYGTMGNEGFNWFKLEQAEAITLCSQAGTRTVFNIINDYINPPGKNDDYVVYSDTDSIVMKADHVVSSMKDMTVEDKCMAVAEYAKGDILTKINSGLDQIMSTLNCRVNKLNLKLEAVCDKGIWFAKKRYAIDVLYDEKGIRHKRKRKVTGIEIVRSETPKLARKYLSEVIDIMFDGTQEQLYKKIDQVYEAYKNAEPEEISVNMSCSNMSKWVDSEGKFISGAPVQTKSSIAYNRLLKKFNVQDDYDLIMEGEKMKYVYLKKPNPSGYDSIGFSRKLPEEFGLRDYIDVKTMYEKYYLSKVEKLVSFINWNTVKINTIDSDLFGF